MKREYYSVVPATTQGSYNVIDRHNVNFDGTQFCHVTDVTYEQAQKCKTSLEAGDSAWSWL